MSELARAGLRLLQGTIAILLAINGMFQLHLGLALPAAILPN